MAPLSKDSKWHSLSLLNNRYFTVKTPNNQKYCILLYILPLCQTLRNGFCCHSERSEESLAARRFFAALRMTAEKAL